MPTCSGRSPEATRERDLRPEPGAEARAGRHGIALVGAQCVRDGDLARVTSRGSHPWVVGLTGGVATGKSTASSRFAARGVAVIDADVVSREVVAPDTEGLAAVVSAFGTGVLTPEGHLDRAAMRRRIVASDTERRRLEAILHPRIRERMHRERADRASEGHPYVLEVVPLLVETGQFRDCDRVLVVDAPPGVQVARLCARDAMGEDDARALVARQAGRWPRLRHADDVIANGEQRPDAHGIECQVAALDRKYRLLACRG